MGSASGLDLDVLKTTRGSMSQPFSLILSPSTHCFLAATQILSRGLTPKAHSTAQHL